MHSEVTLITGEPVPFPELARFYAPRPAGERVELIVLHHSAGHAAIDLPILLGHTTLQVSAHFYLTRDGAIRQLVPLADAAWHAGQSCWQGRRWVNSFSIGIELENRGDEPWPPVQVHACAALCRTLLRRFHLPADHIVSHQEIACWIEDGQLIWKKDGARRKNDPANFPWETFRALLAE